MTYSKIEETHQPVHEGPASAYDQGGAQQQPLQVLLLNIALALQML